LIRSPKALLSRLLIILLIIVLTLFAAVLFISSFFNCFCCVRITPCGRLHSEEAILYSSLKQLNETNSTLMSVRLEITIINTCDDFAITVKNITVDGYPVLNFTPVSLKPREKLRLSHQVIPGSPEEVQLSPDIRVWVPYDPEWKPESRHLVRAFITVYKRGKLVEECSPGYYATVVLEKAT